MQRRQLLANGEENRILMASFKQPDGSTEVYGSQESKRLSIPLQGCPKKTRRNFPQLSAKLL